MPCWRKPLKFCVKEIGNIPSLSYFSFYINRAAAAAAAAADSNFPTWSSSSFDQATSSK
jgi:hypothetical protein